MIVKKLFFLLALAIPALSCATLNVGVGKVDITPPIGTSSAGYADRKGEAMLGIHDPLLAIALFIDNGEKQVVLCSVDNLGFTYDMVSEITKQIHSKPQLAECEIYIASSHTHSGGGCYLNIPVVGEFLAGAYNPEVTKFYIKKTIEAIDQASQNPIPAKIAIGYGEANHLSKYRSSWPVDAPPLQDVAIIKVVKQDDTPFAVLFNYALHPTVLKSQNRLFSADFVGFAREQLQSLLGGNVEPIYFNGAQGEIIPNISSEEDLYESCKLLGCSLAETVKQIWDKTETKASLDIKTEKKPYSFKPLATPFGLVLPLDQYDTEMNVIVLDQLHAFITIPGELSSIYDRRLKAFGKHLGYEQVSIFGLTNDAHGYIILPESWKHRTGESSLSFGGEFYGDFIESRAKELLINKAPSKF